jgi:CHAT domain-containing protein
MSVQSDNTFTLADNPMNRSGLLMAGGNKAWIGEELSTNREDGILTAYEVSNMSLFNTELVVLSACETGLGDIKGSEGVYGLQRAFKQAGVRYLMMSLWKVPDLATKEFMITFYTEYLTHQKPVREAFKITQSKMKKKYRNEPYKWGGFVLME